MSSLKFPNMIENLQQWFHHRCINIGTIKHLLPYHFLHSLYKRSSLMISLTFFLDIFFCTNSHYNKSFCNQQFKTKSFSTIPHMIIKQQKNCLCGFISTHLFTCCKTCNTYFQFDLSYYLSSIVITILGYHKIDGDICTKSEQNKIFLQKVQSSKPQTK